MTKPFTERSLSEVFFKVDELYGDRNKEHLLELQRLQFLLNTVRTLGKMLRREEKDKWRLARSCASIFSRGRAYVRFFGDIQTIQGLSKKFPGGACRYCNQTPCMCPENRIGGIQLSTVDPEQMSLTITEWCLKIDETYGASNRKRGIDKAFLRLLEEVVEFSDVKFVEAQEPGTTSATIEEKLTLESADIYAWLFAIVALLGIIPEFVQIIEARYCGDCHRCGKRPCICGPIDLAKERSYVTPTLPVPVTKSSTTGEMSVADRHQADRDN